jgi:hypothetical protein
VKLDSGDVIDAVGGLLGLTVMTTLLVPVKPPESRTVSDAVNERFAL